MNNIIKKNIEVFEDTKRLAMTDKELKSFIKNSNSKQYFVKESDSIEKSEHHRFRKPATILVSKKRTLEAASGYIGEKVCILNFASAKNPGGGVIRGTSTQEESICRCSTLYFNISESEVTNNFHNAHRKMLLDGKMNTLYNDDCIYTPEVMVFKSDTETPELLPRENWYKVDVITCAAPDFRKSKNGNTDLQSNTLNISADELKKIQIKRITRILDIAKLEKEDVVILGAFGCGIFLNPPQIVAEAMKEVLEEYKYDFKIIEFAIFCNSKESVNYKVFKNIFEG